MFSIYSILLQPISHSFETFLCKNDSIIECYGYHMHVYMYTVHMDMYILYIWLYVEAVYCKDFNVCGFKLHPTVLLMSYFNKLQLREFCKIVVGDSKHGCSSLIIFLHFTFMESTWDLFSLFLSNVNLWKCCGFLTNVVTYQVYNSHWVKS